MNAMMDGEEVAKLRKPGIGTRVLNALVDMPLVGLLAFAGYRTSTFYAFYYQTTYRPFYYFFYGTWLVYYLLFETIFKRTPGKWVTMTKVVTRKGRRPGFGAIVIRSLIRLTIIDGFLFPFLDRTLHDVVSGTDVVEA